LGGKKLKEDIETKQKWWSMLLGYAEEKRFKRGWAYYQYQNRFDVKPSATLLDYPLSPDREVRNWLKYQFIKQLKGKQKLAGTEAHHAA
jgi:hypothetical protein